MRKVFALAVIIAIVLYSITFSQDTITWTGCGITKKAFMSEIAKAYETKTGTKITLSGGGATKGIRTVAAGTSDMGGTCRHHLGTKANKNELEKKSVLTQVAWDAIVVIVNPNNPVKNISLENLKKIYDGEITNWKDIGGPDQRIILVTREGKTSGVGYMFRHLVYGNPNYEFKARSLKVKSSGPLEKKIETSAAAIGITGISSAKKRKVNSLSLDGAEPTKANISSGKYSLFRPLYVSVNESATPVIKKVVDFMLSDEGQQIISKQGTVNLKEGAALKVLWDKKKSGYGL